MTPRESSRNAYYLIGRFSFFLALKQKKKRNLNDRKRRENDAAPARKWYEEGDRNFNGPARLLFRRSKTRKQRITTVLGVRSTNYFIIIIINSREER